MAWARLDDRWHDHPKTIAAGMEAAGLFVMCLTWAHQSRRTSPTPGIIPDEVLSRFAGSKAKRLTKVLHTVGFFDDREDAGWPIHDFDDYLPKYDTEQAREAGRRGGKASAAKRTAKQTATEPLAIVEADAEQTSSTRASARRNPVPVPSEPNGSAQTLVAEWIDACGDRPPGRVIGQVSKEIKTMLDEGIPYDAVRVGLATWQRKGLSPAVLASVVHEVRTKKPDTPRVVKDQWLLR